MNKNHTIILIFIISLTFILSACPPADDPGPTASPTPGPTLIPTPTGAAPTAYPDAKVAGDVWLVPEFSTVAIGDSFDLEIHVNSGTQKLAAYGFTITYDAVMLTIQDVDEGTDGFLAAANTITPGITVTSGFDTAGTGPGTDLQVLVLTFKAINGPYSEINITIDQLVDDLTNTIGTPNGIGGVVNITGK
ncbi:MAG: hypothetical protein JXJ04_16760 [Spirochaetales bacterium]|nr:hypothetical protein [Spirochaetales bacterium]